MWGAPGEELVGQIPCADKISERDSRSPTEGRKAMSTPWNYNGPSDNGGQQGFWNAQWQVEAIDRQTRAINEQTKFMKEQVRKQEEREHELWLIDNPPPPPEPYVCPAERNDTPRVTGIGRVVVAAFVVVPLGLLALYPAGGVPLLVAAAVTGFIWFFSLVGALLSPGWARQDPEEWAEAMDARELYRQYWYPIMAKDHYDWEIQVGRRCTCGSDEPHGPH